VKIRLEARFVVVGLDVPLAGTCSLLLAARHGRRLVYVGRVEWGAKRAVVAYQRSPNFPQARSSIDRQVADLVDDEQARHRVDLGRDG
jgi:hypothetical protein